jgi:fumarate hydratase class II
MVTVSGPVIGDDKTSEIAHSVNEKGLPPNAVMLRLNYADPADFDQIVDPKTGYRPVGAY